MKLQCQETRRVHAAAVGREKVNKIEVTETDSKQILDHIKLLDENMNVPYVLFALIAFTTPVSLYFR